MTESHTSFRLPGGISHSLRRSAILLALLILVAALSSCERNAAGTDGSLRRQAAFSNCPQTDRAALTALYNATDGPNWHDNSNWLSQQPLSTWYGVTTAENGCVTRLNLRNNNLTGQLPPELGTLPELHYLNLRDNNLTGQFPLDWANATNMTNLYISGNRFRGCIPHQFARLRKGTLRGLYELITDAPTGSKTDVLMLSITYCSTDDDAPNAARPYNEALTAPLNLSYAVEGDSITVSWDPVSDAEYYILYHDNTYDSYCELSPFGRAISCQQLSTVHGRTSYTHADAPGGWNDYWVVACNSSGCSALDPQNTASVPAGIIYRPGVDIPLIPSNLTYAHEGSFIVLNWDPVDGADSYNLYHHENFASSCFVQSDGSSMLCDQVAANLTETTFAHNAPTGRKNFYWVAACNDAGCSPLEGDSPAKPAADIPPIPSNLTYRLQESSILVSWDPVEGADYYNLYHHAHAPFCLELPNGTFSPCEPLAANLTETTYIHSDSSNDKNHYWVAACNKGGCSPIERQTSAAPAATGSSDNDN